MQHASAAHLAAKEGSCGLVANGEEQARQRQVGDLACTRKSAAAATMAEHDQGRWRFGIAQRRGWLFEGPQQQVGGFAGRAQKEGSSSAGR